MRLLELLLEQDEETFQRLAQEHLAPGEAESRADACRNLEAVLRSPHHVRSTLYNRRPPCFWIIQRALDRDGQIPIAGLRDDADRETQRIADYVTADNLGGRREYRTIYRRVLVEAWRSDRELADSEIALLGVLRQELGLTNTDHFLIEHHSDLHPIWRSDHAFIDVLNGLRSGGICHVADGQLILPSDLQPIISQVLGIEAGPEACERLFLELAGADLVAALNEAQLRTSGSKAEKVARLVDSAIQPSVVLGSASLPTLRDICTKQKLKSSGNKDQLVDRLVQHYATNIDIKPVSLPPPPPPVEPRLLDVERFRVLLLDLRGTDLGEILASIGARRVTGAKEHLAQLVIESPLSEDSLLRKLDSKQLEAALRQKGLKTSGNKLERIERLLEHYRTDVFVAPATLSLNGAKEPS